MMDGECLLPAEEGEPETLSVPPAVPAAANNRALDKQAGELLGENAEDPAAEDPAAIFSLDTSMPKRNAFGYFLYRFFKRAFDIFASGLFLLLFCWLYVILAIAVKLSDGGPVLYKHERVGKNGKTFYLPKFRSMRVDADKLESVLTPEEYREYMTEFKLEHDPRITKVGDFLRKTSLDELPNIWMIFTGKLSLVGPRPLIREEVETKFGSAAEKLLSVKPGMIGWWAANGRNLRTYDSGERQQLELYYVEHCSFLLDIKIIGKTAVGVCKRTGAR